VFGYLFLRGRGWSDAGAPRLVACVSVGAWLPACKRRRSAWFPGNEFGFRFLGAWLVQARVLTPRGSSVRRGYSNKPKNEQPNSCSWDPGAVEEDNQTPMCCMPRAWPAPAWLPDAMRPIQRREPNAPHVNHPITEGRVHRRECEMERCVWLSVSPRPWLVRCRQAAIGCLRERRSLAGRMQMAPLSLAPAGASTHASWLV
jgi:hypothetical protein